MKPARVTAGGTMAIVAPAGPVPPDLLDSAIGVLEGWGLTVRTGPCVRGRHPGFGYLSGTDEDRAAEFTAAWTDPAVSVVFAARGGYGSMRMLDHVDWTALAAAGPKVLAGSSDITALHEAVGVHLGLSTLFSPMPASALFDQTAAEHLRATLFEPERATVLAKSVESLRPGVARGRLVGGNLSLLTASIGTPEHRGAEGAIAVLEDITEDVYRLDRLLTQLLRSGWFDGVAGIALGSWHGCGDLGRVRALMLDRLGPLGVPMLWECGFGHVPRSPTLALGVPGELDADAGALTLLEPALA
ncbi:LD-carboxypeptidase [Amycolatopsis minnesotensis]|uniref:LD-carboxypeptidase n=1 Tax=Amycolatopsis minnesotensis TaxID=337894 RepID=A0ABN2PYZ3_9PSEU